MTTQDILNKKKQKKEMSDTKKSFFDSVVNYLNMTFESIGSLSDAKGETGKLWLAELNEGKIVHKKQVGQLNDLAWPVIADNGNIFALQNDSIVKLNRNGDIIDRYKSRFQWIKLLGVSKDNNILGIVYENEYLPAIFSIEGKEIVDVNLSDLEQNNVSVLLEENRTYKDHTQIYIERSERGGRGFDIYLNWRGNTILNVSDCGDLSARQPSLSNNYRYLLFIVKE